MQLEQIRNKAYSDAIRRVPNPSFGASIHEYGETEQEVLKSIDDRFRDEVFIRSMELLHEKRPKYAYESLESYYLELIEALKSAGGAVSVVSGDAWSMDVRFGDMVYRLRLSGVVKLENPIMEDVTMNADPNDAALLLAMIQDIHIPSEDILDKSLQLYKWHQVIEVSALHLIEDVLKEHNCGCSIHICGKDRLKLMVYGKIDDDINDIFTIHTNLKNIRNDLIARLGSH
jgi:hypothetical protein